jgi:hypothetical protein
MADSTGEPLANNPNAPQIPHWLYVAEKENFAGIFLGAIFYGTSNDPASVCLSSPGPGHSVSLGVVIVLVFQCMGALFNPVNRAMEGIRWGLVAYTVAMFSIVTTLIAMNLDIQSISYVDNRAFPGSDVAPPGPFGYQFTLYSKPFSIIPNFLFPLNNWLADGLLVSCLTKWLSRFLTPVTHTALPLLHYLFQEFLGHRPPMCDVHCLCRSVLEPSSRPQRHSRLTSPMQR